LSNSFFRLAPNWSRAEERSSNYRMNLESGTKLGRYQILSLLGDGGMGEVYLAHDAQLNRKIALKILPSNFTTDRDRLRRFRQEATAAASLNHPSIAHIYELAEVTNIH